jgi:hypothetical protein
MTTMAAGATNGTVATVSAAGGQCVEDNNDTDKHCSRGERRKNGRCIPTAKKNAAAKENV